MAKQLRSTNFTKNTIKVLLLEDDPLDAGLVERELLNGGIKHEILVVNNKAKFKQALKNYPADVILSDHSLLNFDSKEALRMVKKAKIKVPFILITAAMTDEYAVNIMKEGANDYILKDRLLRLPLAVTNALKLFRLEKQHTVDRDKATADLSRLNHRLQLATQSANLGIWDWNIEDDTLEWDEGMYLLYGIT
ncbi:MAG: response regulator, partial [Mucilaginibacter sp.]